MSDNALAESPEFEGNVDKRFQIMALLQWELNPYDSLRRSLNKDTMSERSQE